MIAVHGATGFTGGLVSRELAAAGREFVVAGRNGSKLSALADELEEEFDLAPEARLVPELTPAALSELVDGVDVLINCVGPFIDYGRPVVSAAVESGTHYFDTTGEQRFMVAVRDEFGAAAEAAGVALCPACAFEFATGDCAAALLAAHGVRDLVVAYATTSAETSRGTKKSIVRAVSHPGRSFVDGEEVERKPAYRSYQVPLGGRERNAIWIPGGESLLVPLHHRAVRTAETALVVSAGVARVLKTVSGAIPAVASTLTALLDKVIEHTSGNPHEGESEPNRFAVTAVDQRHPESWVRVSGEDPYVLTAQVITEAARRVADDGPAAVGYTSPAVLFDPRELMESVDARVEDAVADQ